MPSPAGGVIPPGDTIPSLRLPLLGGGEASLPDESAAGLTLAVFYKNTCPTCRLEMPFLERLYQAVSPAGGRVVAISQDGMEGAASFAAELSLDMPILVDGPDWPVSRMYGLVAVPTLYLVDRTGRIEDSGAGFDRERLRAMAERLASSVGAPRPELYREGEAIPEFKPG